MKALISGCWLGSIGRTSERLMFGIAGILFFAGVLGGTVVLLERDKSLALADEAERGKLLTTALASNVSRTMAALESTMDSVEQQLEGIALGTPESETRMANLAYRSTLLRSLSILTPDGYVIESTAAGGRGQRVDLAALGFTREILSSLEPGMPQPARDLWDLHRGGTAGGAPVSSLPFARAGTLAGKDVIILAMTNPGDLFLNPRSGGEDGSFAAVFDYQGRVLAATAQSDYATGKAYPQLPLPGLEEDSPEYGRFRAAGTLVGESARPYIVNFRSASLYPLIAVTGRSEEYALASWRDGSRNVMWLGLAAAVFVLLYTAALWRVMSNRQNIEAELVRARDAAEQANAARGVFLSTMSHEIRTPMNAVLGMAELLRDTPLDSEQDDYVRTLQESARALLAIIDDVLDFSKIDAGKMTIEQVPLQLEALARASTEILASRAREKNLELSFVIEPSVPELVKGDVNRLRQILLNLLGNAVKFTESGQVSLRIFAAGGQGKNALIRFEVADTGIGIDPATATRLFTPFTQADGSVTRRYGGTGLGLSICKRLVELMDGRIGLRSEPGKGSLFWFELPMPPLKPGETIEKSDAAAVPFRTPEPASPVHAYTSCRILLVEDNPMNQKVALRQLAQLGYSAQIANNGEEALVALAEGGFELVLMDCQMPVMDGFEAARRIRELEAAGQSAVQIVAMTANAMQGDRQRCLDAGMDDYLAKPIMREHLAALLARRLPMPDQSSDLTPIPPSAAAGGGQELLNETKLRATFGDDLEFQEEMLALFVTTTGPVLDRLAGAIATADLRSVQALGHRLYGSCGTVGADALAEMGRQAEEASRAGDIAALRELHARMLDTYRRMEKKISEMNERKPA